MNLKEALIQACLKDRYTVQAQCLEDRTYGSRIYHAARSSHTFSNLPEVVEREKA
jgi:hypothetical protein